jgi:hypothetical protein
MDKLAQALLILTVHMPIRHLQVSQLAIVV